eukprot:1835688-Prorocentrum_lima.AAC.1
MCKSEVSRQWSQFKELATQSLQVKNVSTVMVGTAQTQPIRAESMINRHAALFDASNVCQLRAACLRSIS